MATRSLIKNDHVPSVSWAAHYLSRCGPVGDGLVPLGHSKKNKPVFYYTPQPVLRNPRGEWSLMTRLCAKHLLLWLEVRDGC